MHRDELQRRRDAYEAERKRIEATFHQLTGRIMELDELLDAMNAQNTADKAQDAASVPEAT